MGKNSETIRGAYEAFGRQDMPAVLSAFDPSIVWSTPDTVNNGGTYKGHDEVVGFFMRLGDNYEELNVNPQRYVEEGETVVALGSHVGQTQNGDFEIPFVHVWTFTDGKADSFTEFFDTVKLNEAIS